MALTWLTFILLVSCSVHHLEATTFTVKNNCQQTIYAATFSGSGPQLMNGGFELAPNAEQPVPAPAGWSGRFWGRTGCNFDQSGSGRCNTGDCAGVLHCNGAGATPASLVEVTLGSGSNPDIYDVSLVDGFNIGISIKPISGSGDCIEVKCGADLNANCPEDLKLPSGDGCKSACVAFGKPEYCCTGEYEPRGACHPSTYSQYFKTACPLAYSFAQDDPSSTYHCTGADYLITFC